MIRGRIRTGRRSLVTGIFLLITTVCMAAAYWEQKQDTVNILTMASYEVHIEEEYEAPADVLPSQTINKKVDVRNSGTADALVRVHLKKMFGTVVDGAFTEDETLSPDVIEISCNHQYWKQEKDGWYYYMEVLKAGKKTKEPLMESFRLLETTGNEYMGKEGRVLVTMESVQADPEAAKVWDLDTKEVLSLWDSGSIQKDTSVEYLGKNQGFTVAAENTDLFASFKHLTPGCGRSQIITVKNASQEATELFLRGEPMPQSDPSQAAEKLLTSYAAMEITEGQKVIYSGPVSGSGERSSMTQDIPLGVFQAGSEKKLRVKLTLSPDMEEGMQEVTAKVKWIFSAKGQDGTVVQQAAPETGDHTAKSKWVFVMMTSGMVFVGAFFYKHGKRRWEQV